MSRPTLSQIVEIAKQQGSFIGIVKGGNYHFTLCDDAVMLYGDVEVKDLGFSISQLPFSRPSNEFKATIKVFL